jgi:hypothetical protein
MSDAIVTKIHWSFWAIGAFALVWNGLGAANYFAQMSPDILATYRESERAIVEGRPAWATAGFALAVFGGVLGSMLLLLRKSLALKVFVGSLLGVIVSIVHTLGSGINFGPGEIAGIILMPLVVASFLIWYARHAANKGWIS